MDPSTIRKEILLFNATAFQQLHLKVNLIHRARNGLEPIPADFAMRDDYFQMTLKAKRLHFTDAAKTKNFIEYASDIIDGFSLSQIDYLKSLDRANLQLKHSFWNKIRESTASNEQELSNQKLVSRAIWKQRLIPVSVMLLVSAIFMKITKISTLSSRKIFVSLFVVAVTGESFIRHRKTEDIFYNIAPMQGELELQRQDIINRSVVLDGRINLNSDPNSHTRELLQAADGEPDPKTRKVILEAAGLTVIQRPDYTY